MKGATTAAEKPQPQREQEDELKQVDVQGQEPERDDEKNGIEEEDEAGAVVDEEEKGELKHAALERERRQEQLGGQEGEQEQERITMWRCGERERERCGEREKTHGVHVLPGGQDQVRGLRCNKCPSVCIA